MKELCYKIELLPDLTLNKYAAIDGTGVDGVLEKHLAFLRQWNRKGALSGLSLHLFYIYSETSEIGNKLEILFLVRGEEANLRNVPEIMKSSPLSDYFDFLEEHNISDCKFSACSSLTKKEVFIKPSINEIVENDAYYTVPKWEMNEAGRLYNMCKLMEALDQSVVYRVDLYPVEKGASLRESLRKPIGVLRERQYTKNGNGAQRDFEAENVLREYDELMENVDSSPHFIVNMFCFGHNTEDTTVILDAAGAEALKKGSYCIGNFEGDFTPKSFIGLKDESFELRDSKNKMVAQKGPVGLFMCHDYAQNYRMKYLATLFTLEEVAPFFRFPALYEGEVIQKRKETSPKAVDAKDGLKIGVDENGYVAYFPLKNLSKHAFISGVPGAGKTNTMHHITSSLWVDHKIPFLVLEPAKQEYRALANQKGMEDLYIFSPNADMVFPLHINPFEFPKGLMLAEHIRRLDSVFEGAFPLDNPMPFLLDTAIEAIYRELGWTPETLYTDQTKLKFPTMSRLYSRLEEELKATTYSPEIRGNLESALQVRIGSLLRREMGDVFDVSSSTIPPEEWVKIPAIIELESMGTGPANFLTLMLCTLIRETLKVSPRHDKEFARHIIFIEEAHNLIGPESTEVFGGEANPKQAATAFVVKMLAEVRALKEGIVIADQLPTVMAQEVIKNTGLKVGFRITSADDRGLLGSTMAANIVQMEEMATFNVGDALISYEGLMKPFKVKMSEWCGDELDQKIKQDVKTPKSDPVLRKHLTNSKSYRRICERSFEIEASSFSNEFLKLSKRMSDIISYLRRINEKEEEIKQKEQQIFDYSVALVNTPNWESNTANQKELQRRSDAIYRMKNELELEYKTSAKFKGAYASMLACIALASRIQNRKNRWRKLEILTLDENGNIDTTKITNVGIKNRAIALEAMKEKAISLVQLAFRESKDHFENDEMIAVEIERAVALFKTENIWRRHHNG